MLYHCRVDVVRRYELHALAARQLRQLTPRLLVTGWTLLLLAGYALSLHAWSPSPPPIPPSPPPPSTLASLTFKLSLAMARLCHRCAAKCRERCESRGEDLHRRCTYPPFFAFVTIAALAAAAAAAAPTTCATPVTLYITGLATARAVRTVAAKSRRLLTAHLDSRLVAGRRGDDLPVATHRLHVTALLTPRRRG